MYPWYLTLIKTKTKIKVWGDMNVDLNHIEPKYRKESYYETVRLYKLNVQQYFNSHNFHYNP